MPTFDIIFDIWSLPRPWCSLSLAITSTQRVRKALLLDFGLFFPSLLYYTTIINPDFVNGMLQESAHIIYREEEEEVDLLLYTIHSSNFAAKVVGNIAVKVNDAFVEMAF